MMPGNPVLGSTVLRVPAEQSPNFVHLVSGWYLGQNGDAEFNDVTIRAGLSVGGTDLYYASVPAAGNLIASVAGTGGTDAFGNVYLPGVTTYTSGVFAMSMLGGDLIVFTAPGYGGPWTQGAAALALSQSTATLDGDLIDLNAPVEAGEGIAVTGGTVTDTLEVGGTGWTQAAVPAAYPAVGSPSNAGLATYCNQIVQALQAAGLMA